MNAHDDLLARFTAFRVDGEDYTGGPMEWFFRRWVGGLFTADADAVAELLPVSDLWPLQLRPGRALLTIEGADLRQQRTGLPPTRGAFVAVSAMVTTGSKPAPMLLPLLSPRIGKRHQIGVVPLRFVTTNHVEATLLTGQFGFAMRTADIERRSDSRYEEFACWRDGRPVIRLRVRTGGRAAPSLPVLVFNSVRDGQPFRMGLSNPDPGASRLGPGAAMLELTDHELVADLQALRIAPSSWMGVTKTDSRWFATRPPELLGDAHPADSSPAPDFRPGRFIERLGSDQGRLVDSGFDALPFDPNSSAIEVPPMPTPWPAAVDA